MSEEEKTSVQHSDLLLLILKYFTKFNLAEGNNNESSSEKKTYW